MNIALKEASETEYCNYIDVNTSEKLVIQCKELNKILNSIVKTTKKSLKIIDD